MPDPGAQFDDALLLRTLDLLRYNESLRGRILKDFRRLARELRKEIEATENLDRLYVLKDLLRRVKAMTRKVLADMAEYTEAELRELAVMENDYVEDALSSTLRVTIERQPFSSDVVDSIMARTFIEGAPSVEWWKRQSKTAQNRFADIIRMGVLRGATPAQIAREVRELGIARSARDAAALARTSVMAVANEARMRSFKRNERFIKGYKATVTLDTRTSPICRARSGFAWTLDDKPMPNTPTNIPFPGRPPWHWNCRTILTAVLRSWSELSGKRVPEPPAEIRASMTGTVTGDLTYEQWLRRQPAAVQREVLGKGRYDLWKKQGVSLRDMVDPSTGRPLTLAKLRERA